MIISPTMKPLLTSNEIKTCFVLGTDFVAERMLEEIMNS
jgi:hypothetical protein